MFVFATKWLLFWCILWILVLTSCWLLFFASSSSLMWFMFMVVYNSCSVNSSSSRHTIDLVCFSTKPNTNKKYFLRERDKSPGKSFFLLIQCRHFVHFWNQSISPVVFLLAFKLSWRIGLRNFFNTIFSDFVLTVWEIHRKCYSFLSKSVNSSQKWIIFFFLKSFH